MINIKIDKTIIDTNADVIINLKGVITDKWLYIAERQVILQAYLINDFNQVRTAIALGISRGTLRSKLAQYKSQSKSLCEV